VSERGLANARDIFQKEVPSGKKRDHGHLYDVRFALDHPSNILLDRLYDLDRVHDGLKLWVVTLCDRLVVKHRTSLTKGIKTVNF
jgi:hypothetical protein